MSLLFILSLLFCAYTGYPYHAIFLGSCYIMLFLHEYMTTHSKTKTSMSFLIDSESKYPINIIQNIIKKCKEQNRTVIITDTTIINNNETRKLIHEQCNKLDMTSTTIKPSGSSGAFMLIKPYSEIIDNYLNKDELALFVRMSKLPIDKKLLVSRSLFINKLEVLTRFHERFGKRGMLSPIEMYDLFLEMKKEGKSLINYISGIGNTITNYILHRGKV